LLAQVLVHLFVLDRRVGHGGDPPVGAMGWENINDGDAKPAVKTNADARTTACADGCSPAATRKIPRVATPPTTSSSPAIRTEYRPAADRWLDMIVAYPPRPRITLTRSRHSYGG
jgi:hypothetical protein